MEQVNNLEYHRAPFFVELEKKIATETHERKHTRFYKKKQVLYYEGNPVTGIYLIVSGRAKVYKIGPEGKQYILRLANPHEVLGLESIFTPDPYFSSTVEMVEDGSAQLIEKEVIFNLLAKDHRIAVTMMSLLATQLISGDDERVDLAQRAVRERMARLLITLSHSYGVKTKDRTRLALKLSREDIAEMIGTAAESATRLLSEFREEKIIEIDGKDIVVLDETRLIDIAHLS